MSALITLAGPVAGSFSLVGCSTDPALSGGAAVTTVGSPHSATIEVEQVPGLGKILATGPGLALYMLTADARDATSCFGACASVWPPLLSLNGLRTGAGVTKSALSTFERPGGARQVAYMGHPLYTFQEDTQPGTARGEGVETYGGTWWVLAPDGQPVTAAAARS
ncbi:MAG TPA: hypothetical protein VME20_13165 [Acidimicrobiales bacterium]|nr:hypothetical protein [Acidimicrobiales bacterium]